MSLFMSTEGSRSSTTRTVETSEISTLNTNHKGILIYQNVCIYMSGLSRSVTFGHEMASFI